MGTSPIAREQDILRTEYAVYIVIHDEDGQPEDVQLCLIGLLLLCQSDRLVMRPGIIMTCGESALTTINIG